MHGVLRILGSTLLGLILAAVPVAGQAPRSDLMDVLIAADEEGEFVRVTTTNGRSVEGYIRGLDDDVVRLAGGAVELQLVERVEARHIEGRKSTSGIIVGGLAGGLLFGTIGLMGIGACDNNCDPTILVAITAAGVSLGAMVGGMTGAALAPGDEEWTVRWSR